VTLGYPLQLEIEVMDVKDTECNYEFIKSQIPNLHWPGVGVAAKAVGLEELPKEYNSALLEDKKFLQAMHNLLMDVHVEKGTLICPESGIKFTIDNGIPNMM
jgi:multifunctional methyltransferase subunit TRM112